MAHWPRLEAPALRPCPIAFLKWPFDTHMSEHPLLLVLVPTLPSWERGARPWVRALHRGAALPLHILVMWADTQPREHQFPHFIMGMILTELLGFGEFFLSRLHTEPGASRCCLMTTVLIPAGREALTDFQSLLLEALRGWAQRGGRRNEEQGRGTWVRGMEWQGSCSEFRSTGLEHA